MNNTNLINQTLFYLLTWGGLLYLALFGENTAEFAYVFLVILFSPILFIRDKNSSLKDSFINFFHIFIPGLFLIFLVLLKAFTENTFVHLSSLKYAAALFVFLFLVYKIRKIWIIKNNITSCFIRISLRSFC